ncbi:hypothetical protein D3C72_1338960 [compost metagenome]
MLGLPLVSTTSASARTWASRVKMLIIGRLWRLPTSLSLKSWAGVIFTQPVPFSMSACSSATMGIRRFTSGSSMCWPISAL